MIDISVQGPGLDIGVNDTQVFRAQNILSTQLHSLEYLQDMGIDLKYFLDQDFKFQNESFKNYLVEVLANHGINVASVLEDIQTLVHEYIFNLTPAETSTALIAR